MRKLWDRYKYAALILLVGAGLLLWPAGSGATAQTGQNEASQVYAAAENLQAEMEKILGQIQGVGTVRVLLTMDTDGERQLAQNTELQYSGSTAAPEDYSRVSKRCCWTGETGRRSCVTQTAYPTYRGALVVVSGRRPGDVKLAVTAAVSALTGCPATASPWQSVSDHLEEERNYERKRKRNIVVATMAVLVCAAVGLNWKYSSQEAVQQAEETGTKILGRPRWSPGRRIPAGGGHGLRGDDYFASARLTRQQAADSAISLLEDAASQEDADQETANQASESIQVLASYTLKEAQIENLVTAKGYADCVAFMGDDAISIVVSTEDGTLDAADVAKITDIAMTETGYAASAIRIMAAN